MVEAGASEVDEETMVRALHFGHDAMQSLIAAQNQMREQLGKPKRAYEPSLVDEALANEVANKVSADIAQIVATQIDRDDRNAAVDELRDRLIAEYEAVGPGGRTSS